MGLYTILRSNWFPILWLAVILGVTLVPLEATDGPPPILCVLCGDAALTDGILNAALFLPLGAALSVAGWRPWRTIALGALLSCGLETAQFVIPGRDPSLSDVLFNTLGTALGVGLAYSAPAVWRPTPRQANVLSIAGALGAASILTLTGVLLAPSFPEDVYYGGWTGFWSSRVVWGPRRVLQVSAAIQMSPGPVIENSPPLGSLRGLGGTDEAGLQLLFEAIRIAPNVDGDRVMQDAVENRGGNDPIAEDLAPAAEALVASRKRDFSVCESPFRRNFLDHRRRGDRGCLSRRAHRG